MHETSSEGLERILVVNVVGVVTGCGATAEETIESGVEGVIVATSSIGSNPPSTLRSHPTPRRERFGCSWVRRGSGTQGMGSR